MQIDPSPDFDPNAPLPRKVYVGPDVRSESPGSLSLGFDYFTLGHLGRPQGFFWLDARGNDPLGGEFRLVPPDKPGEPGPDGILPAIAILEPNVRLIPEPATLPLLLLGNLGVWWIGPQRLRLKV